MAGPTRVFVPSIYGQHYYGTIYYGGQWVILCPPPQPCPPPTPVSPPPPPPYPPPTIWPAATPPSLTTNIPAGYSIAPVASQAVDYETIMITWTEPTVTANIVDFRLLRSRYGYPVDENDGAILLDSGNGGYPQDVYFDTSVVPGQMHYYGIYILIQLSSGQVWYRAGFTATLAITNFDSAFWMQDRLPEYFSVINTSDEITSSDAFGNTYFNQFMSVLGWGEDYLQTQLAITAQVNNPQVIPVNYLANLAATLGFPYYSEITSGVTRNALSNNAALIQQRGTLEGIEAAITQLTGWGADVRVGYNQMLEDDQADFTDPAYAAWSSLISYDIGEYVSYEGYTYVSNVNNNLNVAPTGAQSNNANWNNIYYTPDTGIVTSATIENTSVGEDIVVIPVPGAGVVTIYWSVTLSGTTSSADANNFQLCLYNSSTGTTTVLATSTNSSTAGTYSQTAVTTTMATGTTSILVQVGTTTPTATANYGASVSFPSLTNLTTGWLDTWEPLIDGMSLQHPTSGSALVELKGIYDPILLEYEANGLGVYNNSGSTSNIELRSVSRTPSDITGSATYPNTGQVVGDGIPVPYTITQQLWNPLTQYITGTIVTYQGQPFLALKSSLDIAPPSNGVATNEWQPIGYDQRIALLLSCYTSQNFTAGGAQQYAVVPYVLWFDETGTFISSVYTRTNLGSGAPQSITFDSFSLPSNWGTTLASTSPDIKGSNVGAWTAQAGTFSASSYYGGSIVPSSVTSQAIATMNYGSANAFVGVTLANFTATGGGNYAGLVIRWASNTSYIRVDQQAIVSVSGTTITTLATHSASASPGDRLTVSANSTTITAYINGSQVSTCTSSLNSGATIFGVIVDLAATTAAVFGHAMPESINLTRQAHQRPRRRLVVHGQKGINL